VKILVVGGGSIAKRHIANLLRLNAIDEVVVFTQLTESINQFSSDKRVEHIGELPKGGDGFNFAIVANETHKHLDTALYLAEKGIHLFIEKPLSHTLEGVEVLQKIIARKNVKSFIAYNLRFLGAINLIKRQLENNELGDLYFARLEVGQYLPQWRPEVDYRKSYSARREKGGGVGLDLSHELDIMRFFWGTPSKWKTFRTKISNLEINSDDMFEGLYQYSNGFTCNVHMDYLQVHKKREFRIVGSGGEVSCDLINKRLSMTMNGMESKTISDSNLFDVNETYVNEMTHFLNIIEGREKSSTTIDDGVEVLRLLEDKIV
jgi:predicted dehydrogenase